MALWGWVIAAFIFSAAASYLLRVKPPTIQRQAPKPAGIDEFNFPTAEQGRDIGVVFGTRWVDGPNVCWYGDYKTEPITEEGYTIGHKYYLGIHMVACHGPVDELLAVRVGDYLAWAGAAPQEGSKYLANVVTDIGTSITGGPETATLEGDGTRLRLDSGGWISNSESGTAWWFMDPANISLSTRFGLQILDGKVRVFSWQWDEGLIYREYTYGDWVDLDGDGTSEAGQYEYRLKLQLLSGSARLISSVYAGMAWTDYTGDWLVVGLGCTGSDLLQGGWCYVAPPGGFGATIDGNTTITIDDPDLFGGEDREGGIVGDIDVLFGDWDQAVNPYLLDAIQKGPQHADAPISSHPSVNYAIQVSGMSIRFGDEHWQGGTWSPWLRIGVNGTAKYPGNNYGLKVVGQQIAFGDVNGWWGDLVTVGGTGVSNYGGYAIEVDGLNIRFGSVGSWGPWITFTTQAVVTGIPAWRGVMSFVLNQVYLGTSQYIKPWAFLVRNTNKHIDWYPAKAPVGLTNLSNNASLFFSLDVSGSMDWGATDEPPAPGSPTRLDIAKDAFSDVFDIIIDRLNAGISGLNIMLVAWHGSRTTITKTDCDVADIEVLRTWVNNLSTGAGGTDFRQAVTDAPGFFSSVDVRSNLMFVITDGEPGPGTGQTAEENSTAAAALIADLLDKTTCPYCTSAGTAVSCYGINILLAVTTYTAYLDNTLAGVQVVPADDPSALTDVISNALFSLGTYADMNPAHIIRACLQHPDYGSGAPDGVFDDAQYTTAADTLWNEGLGLSLKWEQSTPLEDFINLILDHIDAVHYVDIETGKFVLKLLRQDYNAATIPVLDDSNVTEVQSFFRRSPSELANSLVLKYRERHDLSLEDGSDLQSYVGERGVAGDKDASLTLHNVGLINQMGEIIHHEENLPGYSRPEVASMMAARKLHQVSTELSSCRIIGMRELGFLRPGQPFKLVWPEYGIEEIMRAMEIDYGTVEDGTITIDALQDVYGLGESLYTVPTKTNWTDPNVVPAVADLSRYEEATYYEWTEQTWTGVGGRLIAFVAPPSQDSLDYGLYTKGASYTLAGHFPFADTAQISTEAGRAATVFYLTRPLDVVADDLVHVGEEIVQVVSQTGAALTVTRGVLDTTPKIHIIGTRLWAGPLVTDGNLYASTVNAKATPRTNRGELSLALAPENTLAIADRKDKPYAPGKLRLNTETYPATVTGDVTITWTHRDRLGSGVVGTEAESVGPEAGTTYVYTLSQGGYTLEGDTIAGVSVGPVAAGVTGRVESGNDWLLGEFEGLAVVVGGKLTLSEA